MMQLRQSILLPKKEPLRGLIHARFSTEEQRRSSIDDQVASCQTFVESNLPKGWKPEQVEFDVIPESTSSARLPDDGSKRSSLELGVIRDWNGYRACGFGLLHDDVAPASPDFDESIRGEDPTGIVTG